MPITQSMLRRLLASGEGKEEPVLRRASVLPVLTINDIPKECRSRLVPPTRTLSIRMVKTPGRVGGSIIAEADNTWAPKYSYSPLCLEQYMDLVRHAVETRHRTRGDVGLTALR